MSSLRKMTLHPSGVIPKPRVFTSGARDLARIATAVGGQLLLPNIHTARICEKTITSFYKNRRNFTAFWGLINQILLKTTG